MNGQHLSRFAKISVLFGVCTGLITVMSMSLATAQNWDTGEPATFASGVQSATPSSLFYDVSCASAGNCTAVGQFNNSDGYRQPFAMTSTDGVWATAVPIVFADGVQDSAPSAALKFVSCASPGNCTAVGQFRNANVNATDEAFTVTSTNGTWATAQPVVFGAGIQDGTRSGTLLSVSCASVGNCVAVGRFKNASGGQEAFTVTSTNGTWATAQPVVFAANVQHTTADAYLNSVSCASAGNCTAVGRFKPPLGDYEAFTVTSTNGTWATAQPAVFAANTQKNPPWADLNSVSCASPGNCTAVGVFSNRDQFYEGFTMTSTNGTWAIAEPAVFPAGVQKSDPSTSLRSVSCASAGNCTAVGRFENPNSGFETFTMTSTDGVWATAQPTVFAAGVQNATPSQSLVSVSCISAGNCTAAGLFSNINGDTEAFTLTSTNGTWAIARPVVFAPEIGNATPFTFLWSVSCKTTDNCTAVGYFKNNNGHYVAFTMDPAVVVEDSPTTTVAATTTTVITKTKTTTSPKLPATGTDTSTVLLISALVLSAGLMITLRRRIVH